MRREGISDIFSFMFGKIVQRVFLCPASSNTNILCNHRIIMTFQVARWPRIHLPMQETQEMAVSFWVREIPWRKK